MSRCIICNTDTNLVYALHPLSFSTVNLCESCYAKTYFPAEYPKLSRQSMQHIKMMPHVTSTSNPPKPPNPLNLPNPPNPMCNLQTQQPITVSNTFPMPTQSFSGFQFNIPTLATPQQDNTYLLRTYLTCDSGASTPQPNIGYPIDSKKDSRKDSRKDSGKDSGKDSDMHKNNTDVNRKPAPTQAEIAKRLNEFIKKTLFPDRMEFPDMTPNAKTPRVDTDTEVGTD
jgi:hypothetical protein